MRVALVAMLLSAAPAAAQSPEAAVLSAREPETVALLLVTPSGAPARVRSSELLNLVAETFEARTDLRVELLAAENVADCAGRIGCLVRAVDDRRGPRALLVLSSLTGAGDRPDRLLGQWIDTRAALDAMAWDPSEADLRRAAVMDLPMAEVSDPAGAQRYLDGLLDALQPRLVDQGLVGRLGSAELVGIPEGSRVSLDGASLGVALARSVTVVRLPPGRHRLRIEPPGQPAVTEGLELAPGARTRLELDLPMPGTGADAPYRTVGVVGGLGLAAVGAALVTAAALSTPSGTRYCAGCSDRFSTLGQTSPPIGEGRDGFPAVPLGVGLAVSGGVLATGSALEDGVPWWSMLASVVAGSAAALATTAF